MDVTESNIEFELLIDDDDVAALHRVLNNLPRVNSLHAHTTHTHIYHTRQVTTVWKCDRYDGNVCIQFASDSSKSHGNGDCVFKLILTDTCTTSILEAINCN